MIKILFLLSGLAFLYYWGLGGFSRYYKGPVSDHFDGTRFFNPGFDDDKSREDIRKWQKTRQPAAWPASIENQRYDAPPVRVEGRDMRVTFVGHSTFLIQIAGVNILVDPIWSDRASPLSFAGPLRVRAPGIAFDMLPKIDLILVSHNHYDHLDRATLKRIWRRDHPQIVTPLGNDYIIENGTGIKGTVALDWGGAHKVNDKITVHVEQVYHWSARGIYDRRKALWGGFVIDTPEGKIYFAGDTGFRDGAVFKRMFEKYGPMRLAILPVGAYEPRWFMATSHMNPDEAVATYRLMGEPATLGAHYGTIQLTDEGIDQPRIDLEAALSREGIAADEFRMLDVGESVAIR